MGRDKGLLLKEEVPWALYIADKLVPFHLPVILSVNPSQVDEYTMRFSGARLVVDNEAVHAGGPLKGLLSVHEQFPDRDLLLLACDMPDMDHETIRRLLDAYGEGGPYAYYAYYEKGFYQPFCAIYTCGGMEDVPTGFSLQALLKKGNTKALVTPGSEAFRNYNIL